MCQEVILFFTSIKTKMTLAVFLLVVLLMAVTTITAERYFEQQFKRTVAVQQFALLDSVAN
jgi:two-component system, cell cycle sensor histidine kinase and response regulator CckA